MSMMAMPSASRAQQPNYEIVPLRNTGEIDVVRHVAAEVLADGVSTGVIDAALVEFATGMVGQDSEPALVLPLHRIATSHQLLVSATDPTTRAQHLYGIHVEDGKPGTYVTEWEWKEKDIHIQGIPARYHSSRGGLEVNDSYILAASTDDLDKAVAWENRKRAALSTIEETGPLGKASALVESAFGGIPIAEPERAVHEFTARMLLGALLKRQHVNGSGLEIFDGETMIEPRLSRLFKLAHADEYREFLSKIDAAARTVTVDRTIEAARMQILASMLSEDAARFLGKVWSNLERVVEIERLGRQAVGRLVGILSQS